MSNYGSPGDSSAAKDYSLHNKGSQCYVYEGGTYSAGLEVVLSNDEAKLVGADKCGTNSNSTPSWCGGYGYLESSDLASLASGSTN